ncbi:PQQ-binding-like beta-propeller repeat protein [Haloferax sp. AB510]|uniref:outer membrane protein assembly factor BamB family protein n=1 Tax=Haloferax sp. AB510 TaxID=2934172 RepID=UPI00209C5F1B|nr:PQQ-binding-like beta-propeller repeat protein [Haloferax sp. AB510]MCO8265959.1 PQQ-binding-like beta-propeller repeat protein [Haloferax sp. AB510]
MTRDYSRRTVLATLGALTASGVAGTSLADSHSTADSDTVTTEGWSQSRAEPGRTGAVAPESAPDDEYAALSWLDGTWHKTSANEVLVDDGAVFQTFYTNDSTFRGGVVAYEADTGKERWKYIAPEYGASEPGIGRVTDTPAVAEGTLFVTSEAGYTDPDVKYGGLHALDLDTGEINWQKTPADYASPDKEWLGTPLVADGSLYVQHLTNASADPDQQESVVAELDPESGEVVWRSDASYRSYPYIGDDETLYGMATYTDEKNELVAWNANDGSRRWTAVLEDGVNFVDSAHKNGRIYRSSGNRFRTDEINRVVAHSDEDGSIEWETRLTPDGEASARFISAPAVADGTLYVTTALDVDSVAEEGILSTVYALDADTGDVLWTHDTSTELHGDPSVAGDTVYLGGSAIPKAIGDLERERRHPTIHALSTEDGSQQWSYLVRHEQSAPSRKASTPALAGGRILTGYLEEESTEQAGVFALEGSPEAPDSRNLPRSSDAPVARIVTDPEDADSTDLDSGTTVGLDGTASTGEVATYEWQFGEGASFEERGSTTEITLDFCGTLDVTLRVTGPDGNQSTDRVRLSTDR